MFSLQAIHVKELPFPKHGPWVHKQLQVHLQPQVQVSVSPPSPLLSNTYREGCGWTEMQMDKKRTDVTFISGLY